MSNYLASDTDLTSVADAIRAKGGTSAQLAFPAGFVSAIDAISTGGGGVKTHFSGTVSFVNESVTSMQITLPTSEIVLTGDEFAFGIARVVRTGKVENGQITWDENLTVPSASVSSSTGFAPTFISFKMPFSTGVMYFSDGTINNAKSVVPKTAYRMYNNNNGVSTGGENLSINASTNTITIGANAQRLCFAGAATVYEYAIFVLADSGVVSQSVILNE